ncbi:hypothetical protein LTS09_005453 [Friedmanniomyces endolithicus]|nr:hypothetical protein LTS09_005453 [Friedmanniomyces endolithicus]
MTDTASMADEITRTDIADPEGEITGTNISGAKVESRSTSIVVPDGDVASMNTMKSRVETPGMNIADLEGKITTTDTTDTEARPFEFFRLPRELRDIIYDLVARDTVLVKIYDSVEGICEPPISNMKVHNAPYTHLFVLNKRFSFEYSQRAVLLLEHVSYTHFGEPIFLEDPLPSIKSVKFDLTLDWEVLKRVCDAEKITVRMSVRAGQHQTAQQWQEWRDAPRNCAALDSFVQVLQPSTLALYSRDEDIDDEGVRGPKTEQLRQTWTAEGGWKTKT